MNLILTFVWLAVAAIFFLWSAFQPDSPGIFGSRISVGWMALALAGYNLIRWWSQRQRMKNQQQMANNPLRSRRREDDDDLLPEKRR